jgi:hypothetical protein
VLGDNLIFPGSPEYWDHFKGSKEYKSTLYYSYLEYTTDPDALLVSIKL